VTLKCNTSLNLCESCSVVNKLITSKYADNSKCRLHLYQSLGTLKRTELNLFVFFGKSEAEVANNKRQCSRYCVVEANYRQTVMQPLCGSRAHQIQQLTVGCAGFTKCLSWENFGPVRVRLLQELEAFLPDQQLEC